jgi:hypothetical protein
MEASKTVESDGRAALKSQVIDRHNKKKGELFRTVLIF